MLNKKAKVEYARMWPREIFDVKDGRKCIAARIEFLTKQRGVYILYRDDHPYYVGKSGDSLFNRLNRHASNPKTRYYNFWTHFSAFALGSSKGRDRLEAMLIAALPTVNSAKPKLVKDTPPEVADLLRQLRRKKVDGLKIG